MNNSNVGQFSYSEDVIRILTILKLDTKGLYERLTLYFPEYINILAAKRSREHFKDIVRSKYDTIRFEDLKNCGQELLIELDCFYKKVFEIKWYLFNTEDMPNRMEDKLKYDFKELERAYNSLELYLNVEFDNAKMRNFGNESRQSDRLETV